MDVVELALRLPLNFKIRNGVRKYILRKVAKEIGLPREIYERPKKAVQYGSGFVKVVRKIAKRNGLNVPDYLRRLAEKHGLFINDS